MPPSESDRQRIERVAGARRARLTAAPGTTEEPAAADQPYEGESAPDGEGAASVPGAGPNDERLRRDVPPHY